MVKRALMEGSVERMNLEPVPVRVTLAEKPGVDCKAMAASWRICLGSSWACDGEAKRVRAMRIWRIGFMALAQRVEMGCIAFGGLYAEKEGVGNGRGEEKNKRRFLNAEDAKGTQRRREEKEGRKNMACRLSKTVKPWHPGDLCEACFAEDAPQVEARHRGMGGEKIRKEKSFVRRGGGGR